MTRHVVVLLTASLLIANIAERNWAADTVINLGTIDAFDGPNDLDLSGNVVYAINNNGPNRVVNGVTFLGDLAPIAGYSVSATPVTIWSTYTMVDGAAADNASLIQVLREIRCCSGVGTPHSFNFAVNTGAAYKIQALFGENNNNELIRNWDIEFEGALAVDQLYTNGPVVGGVIPNYPGTNFATRWTHQYVAADPTLTVRLGQMPGSPLPFAGGDSNYVISAFIVEALASRWDVNGATPGSGNAGGNWSNATWTDDAAGGTATTNFLNGSTAVFSAGGDGVGTFTVNVDTNVNVNGITFEEGNVTLGQSGGTLTLVGSAIQANGGATGTINAPLAGSVGLATSGAGTVILGGNASNTYTGATTINAAITRLGKTAGAVAIPGGVTFGNGVSGAPHLRMDADNQFGSGSVITFANPSGQWTRFDLLGTSQTLAGVVSGTTATQGSGIIQNGGLGEGAPGQATLTLNGSGSYIFNGYIRNYDGTGTPHALNLVKNGTGTQTLVGPQITYTGTTTINNGTLVLRDTTAGAGGGAQLGFLSAVNVGASGTLESQRTATGIGSRNAILGNAITGSGIININNAANAPGTTSGGWTTVGVTNGLNFSGTININSGVFSRDYTQANAINGTATVNVAAGAAFGAGRGGNSNIGALNGAGDVGALWSGGNVGSITIGNGGGSGTFSGNMRGNGGAVDGSLDGGILNVIKTGAGTQTFVGTGMTYSGSTSVNQGILSLQLAGSGTGFNSAVSIASGATLDLTTSNPAVDNWLFDTAITGVAGSNITKNGTGWVKIANSGGLAGFHGMLTINNGTFGNGFNAVGDWTGSTADVIVNAPGILDLRTDNITIDTLSGSGTVGNTYFLGEPFNTLTLGTGNGTAAFSGTIRGAGGGANNTSLDAGVIAVIKTGTGVQYFDGNNTYAGTTTVQNGFLVISREMGLGSSAAGTTVQNGGTLQLENRFNGNVHVANESVSIVGNGFFLGQNRGALASWTGNNSWGGSVTMTGHASIFVNTGSLEISGAIGETPAGTAMTKIGNGELILSGVNTYTGATNVNAGTLTLASGSLQNSSVNVNAGHFQQNGGTNNVNGSGGAFIASGATYSLNAGTLDFHDTSTGTQAPIDSSTLNVDGTFNFSGGTLMNVSTIDVAQAPGNVLTQEGGLFVIGVNGGLAITDGIGAESVRAMTTLVGGDFVQTDGTLAIDIFGKRVRSIGGEPVGPSGPQYNPTDGDPALFTHSDLLYIADGNATLDGTLAINLNGVEPLPFAWYDVLVADNVIIGDNFALDGIALWRIIDDPTTPGRQILQVATPEPASIILWSGLGLAGLALAVARRRRRK